MDKIQEEFKKVELECAYKQKEIIMKYFKQNGTDKKELQNYLDRIMACIRRLENMMED